MAEAKIKAALEELLDLNYKKADIQGERYPIHWRMPIELPTQMQKVLERYFGETKRSKH